MIEEKQNQMFIYMPCIFWHDRKGILSIDILQQTKTNNIKKEETIPIYKIVTASIQKEIRVWNFRFEPIESSEKIKISPKENFEKKKIEICQINDQKKEEIQSEDSIVFLEQKEDKKVLEKENTDNFENKKEEQVLGDIDESKIIQQPKIQASNIPFSMSVEFLANLEGHRSTTNVVRFSPNGNFIASGDADGYIIVWILNQPSFCEETDLLLDSNNTEKQLNQLQLNNCSSEDKNNNNEIPPNRENWQRNTKARFSPHPGEITSICFSPDSQFIASVSMNNSISVNRTETGKKLWERGAYRHFANGITWDPRGKYLLTLSTDRRLDVLDAFKGTILPAQLEVGTNNIYGTLVFFRNDLKFCRPNALFPSAKPTIQVKCSPLIYKLDERTKTNFLGLPHRLIFAVLCWDSILFYNSQNETPFAYLANLHYDGLTSISWTPDGRFLIVSSLEGFNSFICMDTGKMGIPIESKDVNETQQNEDKVQLNSDILPNSIITTTNTPKQIIELSLPDSPKLITPKRPRVKRTLNNNNNNNNTPQKINETTPKRAKPEENCCSSVESPKVVERKKPRKVTVISTD